MCLHIEGGGDVASLHEVVELDGEYGAVHDVVEGFLRGGGVLLFDLRAEGAPLAEVPCHLWLGEGDVELSLQSVEITLLLGGG